MSYRTLKLSLDPRGVLTISLNRPEIKNAFNPDMIEDLARVFTGEGVKNEVRVIVLRGEGSIFCAGGDLNWMKTAVDGTFEENLQDTRNLTQMFATLNECPKPVIGVIQGAAIGGGVGLVSICDVALATEDAQFSLSEVRLGIVPACIGPFVISKIGVSHARCLFMSAERFDGRKAREIGLVHRIAPDELSLQKELETLIESILLCGPNAMAVAKKLVLDLSWSERRKKISDPLEYVATTLAELRISAEGQEGVRAFLEKRKPAWISSK